MRSTAILRFETALVPIVSHRTAASLRLAFLAPPFVTRVADASLLQAIRRFSSVKDRSTPPVRLSGLRRAASFGNLLRKARSVQNDGHPQITFANESRTRSYDATLSRNEPVLLSRGQSDTSNTTSLATAAASFVLAPSQTIQTTDLLPRRTHRYSNSDLLIQRSEPPASAAAAIVLQLLPPLTCINNALASSEIELHLKTKLSARILRQTTNQHLYTVPRGSQPDRKKRRR